MSESYVQIDKCCLAWKWPCPQFSLICTVDAWGLMSVLSNKLFVCDAGRRNFGFSVFSVVCVHICAWTEAIRHNFRSCVCACESEWWRFGSGYRVYCNQMWTGMWRAGMHWLLSVSHPSFSSLCPLSTPHASFYTTASCCPSDLLFRPSVCLRPWGVVFFLWKQHTVFISVNLLTIFVFTYLGSKMFQSCWCCNLFCHHMLIFLILCWNSHNNEKTDLNVCEKKCHVRLACV